MPQEKRLILLELNEINFDAVQCYVDQGLPLPGFKKILNSNSITTQAETEYEQLEPWIQWPSIHTGKTFAEHKIFRLGDIVDYPEDQLFEKIERAGFKVGAVSPMNASNKLKSPAYFIPDPWTLTPSDGSFFSKSLHEAISQAVNDNSQSKLTLKSIFSLGLSFLCLVKASRLIPMMKFAISSKGRPWRKALFLDIFLFEVHQTFFKRKKPNFSTLFLNAGAHIQHHYFFNSMFVTSEKLKNPDWYIEDKEDPFKEMLLIYDAILLKLLNSDSIELVVATGFSQKVHKHLTFYYRLKEHGNFLNDLGIDFKDIHPRMTRDFLISFETLEQANLAEKALSEILLHGERVFGEIDNRGSDLFVTMTYDKEITNNCSIVISGLKTSWLDHVTFVAIKNGEHQSKGYAYFSDSIARLSPPDDSNITEINKSLLSYFEIDEVV
jgi:hypothetical protein